MGILDRFGGKLIARAVNRWKIDTEALFGMNFCWVQASKALRIQLKSMASKEATLNCDWNFLEMFSSH